MLPVPKLFFGYARDLTALYPFGVGGAGIVFPERTTPERIFELIAEHRPTILVNVPTMMAQMIDSVRHGRCQTPDMSCLRLCTSAGEALPRELARPLAGHLRRRGARRDRLVRAVPHLHLEPTWPRARRAAPASSFPATRRRSAKTSELLVTGDTAALYYFGDEEKTEAHVRRRHGAHRRPVRTGRRRLLLVPRPRGRPDQGRRHLGRAGRDRALSRRRIRTWSSAQSSARRRTG